METDVTVTHPACAVGRTIGEICIDLAVVPGFFTSVCWNGMRKKGRREQAFIEEQAGSSTAPGTGCN